MLRVVTRSPAENGVFWLGFDEVRKAIFLDRGCRLAGKRNPLADGSSRGWSALSPIRRLHSPRTARLALSVCMALGHLSDDRPQKPKSWLCYNLKTVVYSLRDRLRGSDDAGNRILPGINRAAGSFRAR